MVNVCGFEAVAEPLHLHITLARTEYHAEHRLFTLGSTQLKVV